MRSENYSEEVMIAAEQNWKEKDFWLKQLSGQLVRSRFPYDFKEFGDNLNQYNFGSVVFQFKRNEDHDEYDAVVSKLIELSKGNEYSLNLLLITGVILLLHKYTGSSDIIVGTPIYKQETQGDFLNTVLVLRIQIKENMTFKELILQVRQAITEANENQNYPIHILVDQLDLDSMEEVSPVFDVAVLFENIHHKKYLDHIRCNMTFLFAGEMEREFIKGVLEYNSLRYEESTAKNIIVRFTRLLRNGLFNVDGQLSQLEMVTENEKKQILYDFNRTAAAYPKTKTIHQWFEEQAEKTPHPVAVSKPIDLTEIYDHLESGTTHLGVMEKIGTCCFKKNPWIYQTHIQLPAGNAPLILLKTHRHNSVMVNNNMIRLLGLFTTKTNLEAIYSRLKEMENQKGTRPLFLIYSMSRIDLLEVTHQFNLPPAVFSIAGFEDLVRLVQLLYRAQLIELAGVSREGTVFPGSVAEEFEADEFAADESLPRALLTPDKQPAPARVLLLGDTPGMPSTGLLYLASYLTRKGIKARCRFYDASPDYISMKKDTEALLEQVQPRVVAISMKWFSYIARVIDMCKVVKDYAAIHSLDIKVVVGGNTASYYRDEIIRYDCIDVLVQGDGEEPLLKICQGEHETNIPNCLYKKGKEIIENPATYIQDETNSPGIYLSHLDEILISDQASRFGTFFIYTHKGCLMNCFYCGGCHQAQQKTFNRKNVLRRGAGEVRKDILAAKNHTSTFQFDFDLPVKNLLDYCKKIWAGIDLSGHFCIFSTLTPPSAALIEFLGKTFKYVYWDFDITTLSGRHREQLVSLGLVKPQPSDREIMAFMAECEKYPNIEVRPNLITGLPFFTSEDFESSKKLLDKITGTYSCFGELHWARLHAQPGAPILARAGEYHMHSYATTFEDFLKFSRENFKPDSPYPFIEDLNYPYIYFKDDRLNSRVTNFYLGINRKVDRHRNDRQRGMMICDTLTYRELNEKAHQISNTLRTKGIEPGNIVGLMLERSIGIPVGILGILKAGCAYMPIDPGFPKGRVQYMLKDSNAKALVTTRSLAEEGEKLRRWEVETILLEDLSVSSVPSVAKPPPQALNWSEGHHIHHSSLITHHSKNLAYVIYTSGTTGKPKGVLLKHENLANYVHWFTKKANLTENDKTILTTSFAFDLGYTSLYPPLLNGGELHILPREIYLLAERFIDYIKQKGITYLKVTPSLFSIIVNNPGFPGETCKTLRMAAVGGEAINVKDIETAHHLCPHIEIMNHYGPTEATIGCVATFIDFDRFEEYRAHPVIGKPIYNTNIYILAKDFNLLPAGIPGELCISGTCLARGYLNRPGLTAEKFRRAVNSHLSLVNSSSKNRSKATNDRPSKLFPNDQCPMTDERLYHTGDLARWMPNGTIEFLGRIDKQVKIRGYRIEPGEIENRLLKHSKIENALVLVKEAPPAGESDFNETRDGNKYLCAYIVPKEKGKNKGTEPTKEISASDGFEEEYPNRTLQFISGFKEAVKKNHDKIAVKSNSRELTYGFLDKYAVQVAREILEKYDDTYSLSNKERQRYKRQMLLYGWGIDSQERLKSTTVFVAGAGGGGSPTIMQLALLGFGTIKICDLDEIELSNLNRQFLHNEDRIGKNKALSAQMTVKQTNPHVNVIAYQQKLTRENVFEMVGDSAVIFDMFDGPGDKFILSECAAVKQIPHIIIAMTDLNAYSAVCHTPHTPCYHCLIDKQKLEAIVSGMQNYNKDYSKNPLAVAAPSLFTSTGTAVTEALKILLGFEKPAYNKFFYFNQRGAAKNFKYTASYQSMTHLFTEHFRRICQDQGFDWDEGWRGNFMEVLDIEPDPGCPVCGPKGLELRKLLEDRMKKAKPAPLPLEIKEKKTKPKEKRKTAALLLNHDMQMAAGIIAAMKAGKTFVPLDPASPMDRLSDMLTDSASRIILTDNRHFDLAKKLRDQVNKNINVINLDHLGPDQSSHSHEDFTPGNQLPGVEIHPDPAAFILYSPDPAGNCNPDFNASIKELYRVLLKGDGPYGFKPGDNKQKIRPGTLSAELRDYLLEQLPEYMIPSYFVPLDRIPLTPNEKVDIKALPGPGINAKPGGESIVPGSEVEEKLAEIWAEILGIEKSTISINTNFFEAGGHSLNAAIMVAKIHKELNLKLSLAEVFEMPALKGMASLIERARQPHTDNQDVDINQEEKRPAYSSIEPVEKKNYYPLSPAQKRLFVLQQMDLESTAYNIPILVELGLGPGPDQKSLQEIFLELIRRHDSLRTTFKIIAGEPVQQIHPQVEFAIRYHEATALTSGQREEKRVDKIIEDFVRPFDLSRAPLLRAGLIQVGKTRYLLVVDMHHIISDAVSHHILVRDCMALFAGEKLPPLRLQYKDYSHWQQSQQVQQVLKQQEVYWLKEFAGKIPVLKLPTDYPRPPVMSFAGSTVPFSLKEEETNRLDQLARSEGATLFMVLLALFNITLSKISHQEDIIIGTPVMGRGHTDLQQIIGMFVNTLTLRNYPQKEKTFREFLKKVKKRSLEAFDNQDYQFEDLVDKVVTTRHVNRHPLFDVFFSLDIAPGKPGDSSTSTTPTSTYQRTTTKFDLKLEGLEAGRKLNFTFAYSTKLFKPETIERFISYFKNIVSFVLHHPDETISGIELLSQEERTQLIKEMRDNKSKQFIREIKPDRETGSAPGIEADFDF